MKILNKIINTVCANSPTILVGLGIVGGVAATVVACKATVKAVKISEELAVDTSDLEHDREVYSENDGSIATVYDQEGNLEYSPEIYAKNKRKIAFKAVRSYCICYAPAVGLGVLSITSVLCGFNILRHRYLGLAAAYTAVSESYAAYRQRVADKYGKDAEMEIYTGQSIEMIEEKTTDKNGKTKTKKVKQLVVNGQLLSPYARWFDVDTATAWDNNPDFNRTFLKCQEDYWNGVLKRRNGKAVFLNEIFDSLGIERCQEGQSVGWVYNGQQDNYIDFGLMSDYNEKSFNGQQNKWLLDFNVDGTVYC